MTRIVPALSLALQPIAASGPGSDWLTFHSGTVRQTRALIRLGKPARVPSNTYAPKSDRVSGNTAYASSWDNSNLTATLRLRSTVDAADLQALEDEVVAYLDRRTFLVRQTINGVVRTWRTSGRGTFAPVDDSIDTSDLGRLVARYQLALPIYPNPVVT